MKHFLKKEEMETRENTKIYDITQSVERAIGESEIKNGHVLIQPLHTTVGIFLNENEELLLGDFIVHLSEKVPNIRGKYRHDCIEKRDCPADEPENGHSHIKAALYSNPSLSLVLFEGKLQLGTWQRVIFAEFDGPCPRKHKSKRQYIISVIGE